MEFKAGISSFLKRSNEPSSISSVETFLKECYLAIYCFFLLFFFFSVIFSSSTLLFYLMFSLSWLFPGECLNSNITKPFTCTLMLLPYPPPPFPIIWRARIFIIVLSFHLLFFFCFPRSKSLINNNSLYHPQTPRCAAKYLPSHPTNNRPSRRSRTYAW